MFFEISLMVREYTKKRDLDKTKKELILELEELRKQLTGLKKTGRRHRITTESVLHEEVENELQVYRDNLKELMEKRYAELTMINEQLEQEIKERIKTEVLLRKSEEKYRILVENADDVITLRDLKFNLLFYNRAYYTSLGFEENETGEIENLDRIHHDDLPTIGDKRWELFKTGKTEYEYRIKHKDGHWVHRFVKSVIIQDIEPRRGSILSIIRDITKYKETEEQARQQQEQLIQADKMVSLGTLVSGVAHEINNPNNFLMLNIPLLLNAWTSVQPILDKYYRNEGDFFVGERLKYSRMRDSIHHLFSGILDGSKRIKSIVEQLKNFSRIETFDTGEPVDINEVIKTAVELVSNLIKESTKHFSVEYGHNLPKVEGSFQRLEQVIVNLLENSCQALPDAGRGISLSTRYNETANIILVKVKDEGKGIPPDTLSQILEPFFTTRRDSKGTGLGLSVSSNIIKNHDGFLNFESTPGKGTTATIILPVKKEKSDPGGQ
ncbi:MAG: PAS domain S-box protein [Candidatus Aminicenantes bacterium]|nr:PAS domain S-box protein [Candidatus Aminicenantes bacterium]